MSRISYRDYLYSFIITLLILSLNFTPVVPAVRSSYLSLVLPLQYGLTSIGHALASELSFWGRVRSLKYENTALALEKLTLQGQISKLSEVERENQVLREQLALVEKTPLDLLEASVVGFGERESSSTLIIDRGQRDGVVVGSVVINGANLVGKVVDVAEKTAFVRLILDDELRIAALDQESPQRARGVVRGQFSRLMLMDKILKDEEVHIGDIIITSGEDAKFPKGLIIGEVKQVKSGPEGLLKEATVESLLNLTRLEEVFIIKTK